MVNGMCGSHNALGGREAFTGFCCRNLNERDHLGDPRHRWGYNIKIDLGMNWDVVLWTELSWLRIGTGGGLL
jgi:hypothetical protein